MMDGSMSNKHSQSSTFAMLVTCAGKGGSVNGQLRVVSPRTAFIRCRPDFQPGERVITDVMLAPGKHSGIRLVGMVIAVRAQTNRPQGIDVRWTDAGGGGAATTLEHFLRNILGLERVRISSDGQPPFPFRYHFASPTPSERAPRSRPRAPRLQRTNEPRARAPTRPFGGLEEIDAPAAKPPAPKPRDGKRRKPVSASEVKSRQDSSPPAKDGDRRSRPRMGLAVPVTWFLKTQPVLGQAVDLSRSGIYVNTDHTPPPVGSRVTLRMPVLADGLRHVVMFTARVVRHKHHREKPGHRHGFGARFTVVDELGHVGIFKHFVDSHTGVHD